jgi:hypothetical protein
VAAFTGRTDYLDRLTAVLDDAGQVRGRLKR